LKYFFHHNIVIRTPLKPFKKGFDRADLKEILATDVVREALFLSSPELLAEFEKTGNGFFDGEDNKLPVSLLKYIYRMHTRCTPFGLFAGCSVSGWGSSYLLTDNGLKRSTRLDMEFTCALVQVLEKLDFIRPFLKYYPNSSSYHDGTTVRYIEYYFINKKRIHQLCEVILDEYIGRILSRARNGATFQELVTSLDDFELSLEDSSSFITDVINAQLLVSELEPTVTGDELLKNTLRTLKFIESQRHDEQLQHTIALLEGVQMDLKDLDGATGNTRDSYLRVASKLDVFNIPYDLGKLFQTDLFKKIKQINEDKEKETVVQDALIRAIKVLRSITPKFEEPNLAEFKKSFFARYEYEEISLLEALDNEWGIGYGSHNNHTSNSDPFLENLGINTGASQNREIKWDRYQTFFFKKLLAAKAENRHTVMLSEAEVKGLEDLDDELPATLAVTFNYVKNKKEEYQLLIKHVSGPTANHMLGRFAAVDPEIKQIANYVSVSEKDYYHPRILAVLSHLPESRTGNVLVKPMMRDFEISYLSNSAIHKERQIPLDDLYVSVRNDRLYLRSKSLNQEIIPRIDNAHNFRHKTLPLYHFLGDLQTQGIKNGVYFHWGALANEFKFLPRVEIGNVIVFRATWQLSKDDYNEIITGYVPSVSSEDLLALVLNWRENYQLPALVLLIDGDNELLINFDDEFSRVMFISMLKNRNNIILKEFLFGDEHAVVKNEAGEFFTNEMIAVLNCEKDTIDKRQINGNTAIQTTVKRKFPVGSEWLYYKIYCGKKTADLLLQNEIRVLTGSLIDNGIADYWFFIRYNDPDPHIRLRIHLPDPEKTGAAIRSLKSDMRNQLRNNLVWKLQLETYQRELERYGQSSIEISEKIFFHDSALIVSVMHLIKENSELRFMFALKAVDLLLSQFQMTDPDKLYFLRELENDHLKEFGKDMKERVNKLFREKKALLHNFFNSPLTDTDELNRRMNEWTEQVTPLIFSMRRKIANSKEVIISTVISAHIHMLLNRLFRGHQRLYEVVIYSFLHSLYRSEIAKNKIHGLASINKF
jgi:thiopeptide-type bacteriocin biosynthesis protein